LGSAFGFPFLLLLWLPLHQGHTLFNPVESQPVMGLPPASWLPLFFCNLAGKDAGQNNTKMLSGLNADC
jgi:hypothetical protein